MSSSWQLLDEEVTEGRRRTLSDTKISSSDLNNFPAPGPLRVTLHLVEDTLGPNLVVLLDVYLSEYSNASKLSATMSQSIALPSILPRSLGLRHGEPACVTSVAKS